MEETKTPAASRKRGGRPEGSRVRYGEGGRAKLIRTKGRQWSDEAEIIFFDALAASCNVRHAAEAAGATVYTVHRQRRLRPEFALRWDAALAQGHARLEMALVEAALDSLENVDFDAERPIPRMTVDQAIRIVQLYRGPVRGDGAAPGRRPRRRSLDEVRASILKKLEAIENARGRDGEG